jgi:hypothetical protein
MLPVENGSRRGSGDELDFASISTGMSTGNSAIATALRLWALG